MLGVFSFHFCQSPIVFHGFGFCKYVNTGVSFFVSPLSFFKENYESNTEMKRPLLKWLMIILRLPHVKPALAESFRFQAKNAYQLCAERLHQSLPAEVSGCTLDVNMACNACNSTYPT